jgi:Sulfotransferase family/SEC-C motif
VSALLDRPVFIVAAPRSCSTLLFQTLAQAEALWTLGDESHRLFESYPKLSPMRGVVESNRLTADLLDPKLAQSIPAQFLAQIRDREGRLRKAGDTQRVRLLEKTPKNALRIPFLDALFPDALFVYLVRDPLPNLSSIIDAWGTGSFVTYRRFPTVHGPWSLLLPPGWQSFTARPLEEIAAFQWCSTHACVMADLAALPRARWTAVNAADLIAGTHATVSRLCAFMDVPLDAALAQRVAEPLPLSRYTVTAPSGDKWKRHAGALARVWATVAPRVEEINRFIDGLATPLDATAPAASATIAPELPARAAAATPGRNEPCPCGSGQRYKACHGRAY